MQRAQRAPLPSSVLARGVPLWAAWLAACVQSPAAPESAAFTGGTRLRPVYWDGGDGATAFIAFHDVALDVDCGFAVADDGTTRCIPMMSAGLDWSDPDCTGTRVYTLFEPCDAPPAYVTEIRSEPCDVATTYRVGARLGDGTAYSGSPASCFPYTAPTCTFAIEPVAANELVAAHARREPSSAGLERVRLVAEDGASIVTQLWDVARDAPCEASRPDTYVRTSETVAERCVPANVVHSFDVSWVEPTCVGARAVPTGGHCLPASAIVVWSAASCGYDLSFVEPGTPLPTAYRLEGEPAACTATSDPVGTYVGIGAAIDPTSLPVLPETVGSGRLRNVAGRAGFFDTALGVFCDPVELTDGSFACTPATRADDSYPWFADDACVQPVASYHYLCGAAPTLGPSRDRAGVRSFHRVTTELVAPSMVFTTAADGSCVAQPVDTTASYWRLDPAPLALAPVVRIRS